MDADTYIRFFAALVFVIALISASAWIVRRTGLGGMAVMRGRAARRISVVESVALDSRRRLVLVRRDGVEHLLLIGGVTDLVVEAAAAAPDSEQGA